MIFDHRGNSIEDNNIVAKINEDGSGTVAFVATAEQVKNYYEAVEYDEAKAASNLGNSTDHSRYDTYYAVDPVDSTATTPEGQISELRNHYATDPLLSGVIDVLSDLTAGQIRIEGGNEQLRKLFYNLLEELDLDDYVDQMSFEYWLSGNVFGKCKNSVIAVEDAIRLDHKELTGKVMPVKFAVLDTLSVDKKSIGNNGFLKVKITNEDRNKIKEKVKEVERAKIDDLFGKEFVDDVLAGNAYGTVTNIDKIFYKKQPYQSLSYPPGGAALPMLQYKKRLRNLNLNTISNAISFIVLVKLGSDKLPVTKAQLTNFSNLWKDKPRRNSSSTLFQPHTTDIQIITLPEGAYNLLGEDLFRQPNLQIAHSFGINIDALMGLGGSDTGGYSTAALALRPTIRRIVKAQLKQEKILYRHFKTICFALGYSINDVPKPQFDGTGLENYAEMASAFSQALDRGISIKTYLERALNLDFYKEKEQKEWEAENDIDETFKMRGAPTQVSDGRPKNNEPNPSTNPDNSVKQPVELAEMYEEERESIENGN